MYHAAGPLSGNKATYSCDLFSIARRKNVAAALTSLELRPCCQMPSLASSERYQRAALRMAVAQVCQTLGWQSASSSALDVLVDVAQNHLMQMARLTARYANQCKPAPCVCTRLGPDFVK